MDSLLNSGSFTVLDLLVAALVLISSLMAIARGFLREVASLIAFLLAVFAGLAAHHIVSPMIKSSVDLSIEPHIVDFAVVVIAFLAVYIIAAVLGRNFSRFIQAGDRVGFFDRIIGLVFGIARALAVVVLMLTLAHQFLPSETDEQSSDVTISWLQDSYSYKQLKPAVLWSQEKLLDFMDKKNISVDLPAVTSEDEQN